jgi:putative proteasome-type protease
MTYCLALRLHEGLVFLADTRTNAGLDNVGVYRKLHVLRPAPDRVFVLESAGNLATTQEVLDRINRDLATTGDHESLATVQHLFEAALYVGRLSRDVSIEHREATNASRADFKATFILGGQIAGAPPDILLVYPEGNYIRASDERPFLQIGESKYGKFMLELAVEAHVDLVTATKIALGSMMSTARANLSVGPPYDIGVLRDDGHLDLEQYRVPAGSGVLTRLQQVWDEHLLAAVAELPDIAPMGIERLEDLGHVEPDGDTGDLVARGDRTPLA